MGSVCYPGPVLSAWLVAHALTGAVCRDVTEAVSWIQEKEPLLRSEDCGKDLVGAEALFHSHKGLERSLAVMDDKVRPP